MSLIPLTIIAVILLSGALGAALLPRLVHATLSAVLAFVGAAVLYFYLGAEFVGLVQIFVYVGAVAILIVFTILLTKPEEKSEGCNWGGMAIGALVFAGLVWAILNTCSLDGCFPALEPLTVKQIGESLMSQYVWPLQCVGLLLTAALIGALILVMEEKP